MSLGKEFCASSGIARSAVSRAREVVRCQESSREFSVPRTGSSKGRIQPPLKAVCGNGFQTRLIHRTLFC